jgi:sugar lactone lactonase YvrE
MQLQRSFLLRAALSLAAAMAFSVAWAGNVLIVNGSSVSDLNATYKGHNQAATANLQSLLISAGNTVTVSDPVPAELSRYDEIWDIAFVVAIDAATQSKYLAHLNAGKRLFVIGENESADFMPRNNSMLALYRAAGGGQLKFQAPTGDDVPGAGGGSDITETVRPPFTGRNAIPNGTVTYAAPGGVTTSGNGQFVTRRADQTTGAGIMFGGLIMIFDVDVLENAFFPEGSQPFTQNLISPAGPTVGNVLNDQGRPFNVAIYNGFAYVADTSAHTVWKVDLATGQRTAVAGTGEQGFNGDGIDALQAQLDNPSGVALDASGVLYIADTGNHVIRKVATPGAPGALITTVAGVPTSYAVGESTDPTCVTTQSGAQCTAATGLRLFGPRAVAVDGSGNVYIADRMNQQIKKLYTSGVLNGFIFVVAGVAGLPGSNDGPVAPPSCAPGTEFCGVAARLNSPVGVAVAANGTVYVADEGNNRVRVVTPGNSDVPASVSTLSAGSLVRPTGVAVRGNGDVLIANYGRHTIVARSCAGAACVTTTVAGTGTAGSAGANGGPATSMQLNSPIGVALNGNTVYIADLLNARIVTVNLP